MIIPHIASHMLCCLSVHLRHGSNLYNTVSYRIYLLYPPVKLCQNQFPNAGNFFILYLKSHNFLHFYYSVFILSVIYFSPFTFDFQGKIFDLFLSEIRLFSTLYSTFMPLLFLLFFLPNSLFYAVFLKIFFTAFQQIQGRAKNFLSRIIYKNRLRSCMKYELVVHLYQ